MWMLISQNYNQHQMDSFCDKAIRCLCSCLIKKQVIQYAEAGDQHSKFMNSHEHPEEEPNHSLQSTSLQDKISDYLEEGRQLDNKSKQNKQKTQNGNTLLEEEQLLGKDEGPKTDYSDVMSPDHPYYQIFQDKLSKLSSIYDPPSTAASASPQTTFPLKLFCYQQAKNNVFVYFFTFPTDVDTYESISNDFQLQKKLDTNIEQFKKQYQVVGGDAKLIYLSYKKVLMMSSRDFQYVKYTFKKGNEHWSICVSDLSREEIKGKVRGQMVLTATRIVEVEGSIQVSVYSQIDMKMPIKMEIAKNRGFAQIRKYLDKVYNHIKNSEKEIL